MSISDCLVLERLVPLKVAINNPLWMFVVGAVISVISLIVSFMIFETSVGLIATLLITIAMAPFMINLNRYEKARQEKEARNEVPPLDELSFLQRYSEREY